MISLSLKPRRVTRQPSKSVLGRFDAPTQSGNFPTVTESLNYRLMSHRGDDCSTLQGLQMRAPASFVYLSSGGLPTPAETNVADGRSSCHDSVPPFKPREEARLPRRSQVHRLRRRSNFASELHQIVSSENYDHGSGSLRSMRFSPSLS